MNLELQYVHIFTIIILCAVKELEMQVLVRGNLTITSGNFLQTAVSFIAGDFLTSEDGANISFQTVRIHAFHVAIVVMLSHVQLCDPIDFSPPSSCVHEIF